MTKTKFLIFTLFIFSSIGARADDKAPLCKAMDRPCIMKEIESLAPGVEKQDWKDQSLRELAKTYTYDGETDKALALIDQIEDADTKAMTIRGIGMAAAKSKWEKHRYDMLWPKLAEKAAKINHPPSRGIAYTYIAMSQALAGNDDAARKTALAMDNAALRNKALGETAEFEAGRGDLKNALISLAAIDSLPFRDKFYDKVSRMFLEKAMVEEAYACASKIDNNYIKIKSLQRILNKGNVQEQDMDPKPDPEKDVE